MGNVIAAGCTTFAIHAWLVYAVSAPPIDGLMVLVVAVWGLFSAQETWAFTHDRPTHVLRGDSHEATPANTDQKLFCLLLDMAVMTQCAWMFLRGI